MQPFIMPTRARAHGSGLRVSTAALLTAPADASGAKMSSTSRFCDIAAQFTWWCPLSSSERTIDMRIRSCSTCAVWNQKYTKHFSYDFSSLIGA